MAFLLLQTAIVANDAYVTLNRGRRVVRALFPFLEFADDQFSGKYLSIYG